MSRQNELNLYIRRVQERLRLGAWVRGAAILMAAALFTTLVLVVILNAYAFPGRGMTGARLALVVVLGLTGGFAVAWPVMRLNRRRSVATAEAASPELEQRLTTFSEKEKLGNDPFIELLAADTLKRTEEVAPERLVPSGRLLGLAGAGVGCLAVLVWMIVAGPGYVGYGASLLWTGAKHDVAPLYDIKVTPGDIAVRRHSDQLITAQVIGLKADKVRLFAKYESTGSDKASWEPVVMQAVPARAGVAPTAEGKAVGGGNYQFVFAGLPESVEYYVEAGPLTSKHYKVRVVDLPTVQQIQVTYHYPAWTGLKQVSEEHGGDLRAIEGTEAEIEVKMDRPLREGVLALDGGQQVKMTGGEGNRYRGTIKMQKDGAYHVAALDEGQQVRLSEDYFIATNKAMPPEIRIDRPGGDYRASPIEEVTIAVNAADEFGLHDVELHYSVNGGPEQKVNVLKAPGAKESDGTMTLRLEDYKLVPGDLVSLYATAKDGNSEAKTEMSFIQAEPFEREFSQSQQSGGGGGGGGGGGQQGNQTDISKREKELIAATWKQVNAEEQKDKEKDKASAAKEATDAGNFLSGVQTKLREQVLALSGRMQSRDLSTANEEFTGFEKDMQAAAAAMIPSADKLKGMQWKDAISMEEKALQNLLRAEATFRQIQVAFGQQRGGGGGGGGSAGRDLASLFDLELDTEKNQYETAQTASPAEQKQKEVDDALAKLDALARRQEELAQKPQNGAQSFEQRWQQEMLRREAERLEKQMAQMAENGQQGSQGQQSGQQGQQGGQQSGGQSSGQAGGQSGSQGGQQSASSRQQQGQQQGQNGKTDPRVTQALNRLRQADSEMKQGTSGSQQQSTEAAKRAAEALREAQSLLSGTQQQQASGQMDSLTKEADRIGKEEKAQADRIHTLAQSSAARGQDGSGSTGITQEQYAARVAERDRLAEERQKLSDDLGQLEKGMRNTARSAAPNQPEAASKLRDALNGMDQSDLENRVQRTADWLRQGIDPNSNGTEAGIANDLQKLNEQMRGAQQAMGGGAGKPGQQGRGQPGQAGNQGEQAAALDHVDRLRSQLQSLSAQGRQGQGGQQGQGQQSGQQQGQGAQRGQGGQQGQGQQQGQGGQQAGQGRQQGQGQGQPGQSGQRGQGGQQQGQGGQQQGQGGQRGGGQQNAQQGGGGGGQRGGVRQGDIGGDLADGRLRGGGANTDANLNLDTGGQGFDQSGKRVVDGPQNRDTGAAITQREQAYKEGMTELNKLRSMTKDDPAAAKEIADLVKQMQQLDPSRFVGNPAMVEELHSQVLTEVDKLELQLRRSSDQNSDVRTSKPAAVPPGYEDAVADYYRRLSKGK